MGWKKMKMPESTHLIHPIRCRCGGTPDISYRMELDRYGEIMMTFKLACPICKLDVDDPSSQATVSDNQALNSAVENWNYLAMTLMDIDQKHTNDNHPLPEM